VRALVRTLRALPSGVWSLGLVSLFMDISSEMIYSLLPVFLVTVLGTSTVTLGVIEGVAEASAAIVKVFSGALSDWLGRRKPLLLLGYGLAACTKPLFALASGVGLVFAARCVDRVGKGIRGAPRDALIADYTPLAMRGAAYGLRQSMDTMGAFIGPLLALLLMAASADNFRAVFWVAVVPALVCVGVIIVGVREPEARETARLGGSPLAPSEMLKLPLRYWYTVAFGAVLTLARFSEAFLLLRAEDLGLAVTWIPLVMIVMNVAYAGSAYPLGYLSDSVSRRRLLGVGIVLLLLADVILGLANSAAERPDCRRGPRPPARHCIRDIPSGQRRCAAHRQRAGRLVMECCGACCDLLCRWRLCADRALRSAVGPSALNRVRSHPVCCASLRTAAIAGSWPRRPVRLPRRRRVSPRRIREWVAR
jgi:MFS family permease